MTSHFLAVRVRPPTATSPALMMAASRGAGCWPNGHPKHDEPTGYWLATLPAGTPIAEFVRLARIRWRIEHDCCAPAQDPLRRDDPHRISRTHDRMLWW